MTTINFTNFKGDTGDTGSTGTRGSTWSSTDGVPTVTTDRLEGDQNIDTANGDVYEIQTNAWVMTTDLDGRNIASMTYNDSTGKITVTFNDGSTPFETGDLRGANGSDGDTGPEGPTGPAGVAGTATLLLTETGATVNAFVTVTVTGLGTTGTSERSLFTWTNPANKWTTNVDTTDNTDPFLRPFSLNAATEGTVLGFRDATGSSFNKWQNMDINNSGATTVATVATQWAGLMTEGAQATDVAGANVGGVWNQSTRATPGTTDQFDIFSATKDIEITTTADTLGWTSVQTASSTPVVMTAGQTFVTGQIAYDTTRSYICILGYNTDDNNTVAGSNATNWI